MPGDPKECRENAKRCLKFAQAARTEAHRKKFERFLAQTWLILATDFEAAEVLLEKWGSGPVTFSDEAVASAQSISSEVYPAARQTATHPLKPSNAQALRRS